MKFKFVVTFLLAFSCSIVSFAQVSAETSILTEFGDACQNYRNHVKFPPRDFSKPDIQIVAYANALKDIVRIATNPKLKETWDNLSPRAQTDVHQHHSRNK